MKRCFLVSKRGHNCVIYVFITVEFLVKLINSLGVSWQIFCLLLVLADWILHVSVVYPVQSTLILILPLIFWQSHAGKVVERHWYEKNKHIFPASRWEVLSLFSCAPIHLSACTYDINPESSVMGFELYLMLCFRKVAELSDSEIFRPINYILLIFVSKVLGFMMPHLWWRPNWTEYFIRLYLAVGPESPNSFTHPCLIIILLDILSTVKLIECQGNIKSSEYFY